MTAANDRIDGYKRALEILEETCRDRPADLARFRHRMMVSVCAIIWEKQDEIEIWLDRQAQAAADLAELEAIPEGSPRWSTMLEGRRWDDDE